jgi:hypothetical protein
MLLDLLLELACLKTISACVSASWGGGGGVRGPTILRLSLEKKLNILKMKCVIRLGKI